ncbi:MAG: beta-propeller fold lactonase family protein [Ferruginibacter sp.]
MKRKFWSVSALALCAYFAVTSCNKHRDATPSNNKVAGYLYTSTNGEGTNQVVRFTRHSDGSLTDEKDYSTNSKGGANVAAGGDAHGDFDSEGGVQIIGKYLLAVNSGGNTISVFNLDKKNGNLSLKNNVSSGGKRPVSISYTPRGNTGHDYWVVVGNQWDNPNVQKDGAKIQRFPNNAFFQQDLTLPDASDNDRNINLFTFNSETGVLLMRSQLDKYVRENGGPSAVHFSDYGTKLAVTTWGIAHFATKATSIKEQHPSRVYVYDFNDSRVSGKRYFEEIGIAGSIGFSWARKSNGKMYISNFNLIPSKIDNSVTVLSDNGSAVTKTANFSATTGQGINESCWTALSAAGDKLYVASFQTNLVSVFNANNSGLNYLSSVARGGFAPNGDSKELWISPDNKFVYNLGALQSFSINRFDITGNSITYKTQTPVAAAAASVGQLGKYNFLGLVGFDFEN